MAPDPFRPKEQRAYLHGYDVEIHAHPDSGWTFEVWEVDHSRRVAKGAADSENTVKMLALRTAGECAERRDGVSDALRVVRGYQADLDRRLRHWIDGTTPGGDVAAKEMADDR
jgi:hypothetical protein